MKLSHTVGPVGPVGPIGPCSPVGPVGPVGPVAPVGPVGPSPNVLKAPSNLLDKINSFFVISRSVELTLSFKARISLMVTSGADTPSRVPGRIVAFPLRH